MSKGNTRNKEYPSVFIDEIGQHRLMFPNGETYGEFETIVECGIEEETAHVTVIYPCNLFGSEQEACEFYNKGK